jgi:hypothetical protein
MESAQGVAKLELLVEIGSEPIAGRVRLGSSSVWSFVGWLALTRSVEQALATITREAQR